MTISPLLDFLLPRTCHVCGALLNESEKYICTPCLAGLPRTGYHRRPDNPMVQRFAGLFPFERCTGHFFYTPNSELAAVIHDFKYRHFRNLGIFMGETIANDLLMTGFLNDMDAVIPIPMHFMKQARRGYNQTQQLARGISKVTGIPVDLSLKAVKPHRTQTSMTHAQRLANAEGVFRLRHPELLAGKHILLFDDVCTTGATLTAAAHAILDAQPSARISLLTLAVTF